jgi:hypothetical protein
VPAAEEMSDPVDDEVADPLDELLPPQALRSVAPRGSAETAAMRSNNWRRFIVVFDVLIQPRFLVASLEPLVDRPIRVLPSCTSL